MLSTMLSVQCNMPMDIFKNLIETQITYYKINVLEKCGSILFNMCSELCNYPIIEEMFNHTKTNILSINSHFFLQASILRQPGATNPPHIPVDSLRIFCRNRITSFVIFAFSFICLEWCFHGQSMCSIHQYVIPFYWQIIFCCINKAHGRCIHQLVENGLFLIFGHYESCCSEHLCASFFMDIWSHFSWEYVHRNQMAGSYGIHRFNILGNCQTVYDRYFTTLHCQKQRMRIPFFPHPYQHLSLSVLLTKATHNCEVLH